MYHQLAELRTDDAIHLPTWPITVLCAFHSFAQNTLSDHCALLRLARRWADVRIFSICHCNQAFNDNFETYKTWMLSIPTTDLFTLHTCFHSQVEFDGSCTRHPQDILDKNAKTVTRTQSKRMEDSHASLMEERSTKNDSLASIIAHKNTSQPQTYAHELTHTHTHTRAHAHVCSIHGMHLYLCIHTSSYVLDHR